MDKLYAEIGGRIKIFRKTLGLTQAQVAEQAGMDASFYGQIERGANIPSIRTLFSVAAALGVEPADLLPETKGKTGKDPYPKALESLLAKLKPEKKRFLVGVVRDLANELKKQP